MDLFAVLSSPAFWAAVVVGIFGIWFTRRSRIAEAGRIVEQLESDAEEQQCSRERAQLAADRAEKKFRSREARIRRAAERRHRSGKT